MKQEKIKHNYKSSPAPVRFNFDMRKKEFELLNVMIKNNNIFKNILNGLVCLLVVVIIAIVFVGFSYLINKQKPLAHIDTYQSQDPSPGYKPSSTNQEWANENLIAIIEAKADPDQLGNFNSVASQVSKLKGVQACYLVSGDYDLLIFLEAENWTAARDFVLQNLANIKGMGTTYTRFQLKTYE